MDVEGFSYENGVNHTYTKREYTGRLMKHLFLLARDVRKTSNRKGQGKTIK